MGLSFLQRGGLSASQTLEAVGIAVVVARLGDLCVLDCNAAAEALLAAARAELVGKTLVQLAEDDGAPVRLDGPFECRLRRGDGRMFDAAVVPGPPTPTPGGECRLLAIRDVSVRKQLERQAEHTERKFASLFHVSPDAMIVSDIETGLVSDINPSFTQLFGFAEAEILGRRTLDVGFWPSPEARERTVRDMRERGELRDYETDLCTKDGRAVAVVAASARVVINGRPHWVVQFRDISERKAHLRAMEHLAHHDPLTGLPNRRHFMESLTGMLADKAARGGRFALLLLDLDGFKEVNDALGHPVGDDLLVMVADRLRGALGSEHGGFLARLGGDEFAVVLRGAGADDAKAAARGLRRAVRQAYDLCDMRIEIGVSIGYALYPEHGLDAPTLLRRADVAMYAAKKVHVGWAEYDPSSDLGSAERLALMGQLKEAIRSDQLVLHWQPRVRLGDGCVAGAEALVRWRHPQLGLLGPGVFVPAAEMSSLIVGLTDWVVSAAARQAAAWARARIHLPVSVNLSARNLADDDLPDRIMLALSGYDVPLDRFEFEITETAFLADPRRAFTVISRLTERGARFAIDDFGTGYASLSTLRLLPPVATLKIDRSFVGRMRADAADAAVVETIVGLAQRLGIDSVAEGVEDAETYGMLRELRCSEAQGYWIARPAEAAALTDWLAARGGCG